MTLREDAKQMAREGFCADCKGFSCELNGDEDICDGFKEEVDSILREWKAEKESGDCMANAKDRMVEEQINEL